jgi:hypothetical protein
MFNTLIKIDNLTLLDNKVQIKQINKLKFLLNIVINIIY